jgi:hypothetical protein
MIRQIIVYIAAVLLICTHLPSVVSLSSISHRRPITSHRHRVTPSPPRLGISSSTQHPIQYNNPPTTNSRLQPASTTAATTLNLAVEGDFDPNAIEKSKTAIESGSLRAKLHALYKFTRPHTIRGTVLASIAGTTRALIDTPGAIATANWNALLPRAVIGMIALLLGNAYIVGINQIFDKDIDVMNKPFLPVASGEMSEKVAWITVGLSGIVGPAIV